LLRSGKAARRAEWQEAGSLKESDVKSVLIAVAAALALPLPAAAQSLDETHELVWHPAGKTPAAIHRMRDRPACAPSAGHHQSGKTAMPAKKECATAAANRTATADIVTAR